MTKRPLFLALLIPLAAFAFGGWAVITVDDLPEYLVAGKAVEVPFSVRQHGVTLLPGLTPAILITSGDVETTVRARATSERGHYVATVTVPRAGEYTMRIHSGFMNTQNALLPIRAVAAGAPAPRALADAERGHQLYFAKGCVTCHVRGSEGGELKVGPELTGRRYPPEYVAKFLDDPESSPLSKATNNGNRMPKLDLKQQEIASLVAFLNSEGKLSTK